MILFFRPTVGMAIFLWAFQMFLELFVFRDRDFPNIAITVDNKYDLLSFSCLARMSAWKAGKTLVEKMFR